MTIPLQAQRATLGTFELSATHAGDVDVILENLSGWGAPASDVVTVKKSRQAGVWASQGTSGARYPVLDITIIAPTRDLAVAKFDELSAAASFTPTTLTVVEGVTTRTVSVVRSGEILHEVSADGCVIGASVMLLAADPRKLGAEIADSTGLASTDGGMTFPFEFPFTFPETVISGRVALTNPGNTAGPVVLTITAGVGGLTGPAVKHMASGLTLEFAASLTLSEGSWLVVDMEAQTVLENGQAGASRNSWVTGRQWSGFEPGVNEWAFTAASGVGTLHVAATPAW